VILAEMLSILGEPKACGTLENPPMMQGEARPDQLIEQTRRGDETACAALLELYRNYLRLVARSLIGGTLRVKLDPSDLVQETFLKAHRDFDQFAGGTERELVSWLRQILVRSLTNQVKHHRRQARDHRRQESLEHLIEQSSLTAELALAAKVPSPSEAACQRERAVLLADAVDRLPPDYREAFVLRTLEHVPFDEIAARMGRSIGAVRMLWARAVKKLNEMLETQR
jgi:RNA polymerase sigma-70 factor (ECF subfamily)